VLGVGRCMWGAMGLASSLPSCRRVLHMWSRCCGLDGGHLEGRALLNVRALVAACLPVNWWHHLKSMLHDPKITLCCKECGRRMASGTRAVRIACSLVV
jgi:hypothetical protein